MAPVQPTHDYYVTLEVGLTAPYDEIKAAYRRLALKHHPDKNNGSKEATRKFQRINEAWETLGDRTRKQEYDRSRPKSNPCTAQAPPPQTPPPQANARPTDNAQDEAKKQAESLRKRQIWLDWEKLQEQKIRLCNQKVKPLSAEIATLKAKIADKKAQLAKDVPFWWNVFANMSKRLTEEDKSELQREILNSEAAIRIKLIPLEREQSQLKNLQAELARRKDQELARVAAEHEEKERKERLAREAAAKRRAEEHEKERAAEEARVRAAWAEAERIRKKRMAEEQAAREAARKKREEEQAAFEAARKKMEEDHLAEILRQAKMARERAQKTAWPTPPESNPGRQQPQAKAKSKVKMNHHAKTGYTPSNQQRKANGQHHTTSHVCTHRGWWDRVDGRHECKHCTRTLYTFAYQCNGCETIGCASCMHILKKGGKPTPFKNDQEHTRRGNRSERKQQYTSPPSPDYSESYWDYD